MPPVSLSLALLVFLATLAVYVRTAAPSVMGGDSAEFQMAAPLLGVPHPTTYPLYILLGKLFTLVVPFGDLAHRVTLVSSFTAALAAAAMFLLAQRLTHSNLAAFIAAIALSVAPELWNAATMAEVYGLLAALLAALWLALLPNNDSTKEHLPPRRTALAALIAGLGCSHHALFVLTGMPLFAGAVLLALLGDWQAGKLGLWMRLARHVLLVGLCFALGLTPWLFPLVQYARFGPFSGDNYGLPQHYFWGSPTSWPQVFDLVTGGNVRRDVFRLPTPNDTLGVLVLVARALRFDFGPQGMLLGVIGCLALLWRSRLVWLSSVWIFAATLLYLLILGPAVQDAPVFTIPMLLPWALWLGIGSLVIATASAEALRIALSRIVNQRQAMRFSPSVLRRWPLVIGQLALACVLAMTLVWGYSRAKYANKRHLNVWRSFGEATLSQLPPNAVVVAHWEQGMVLQYLVQVERQRSDVWVDVVEPTDDPWGPRVARRYPDRPVFFIGSAESVAGIPVELVRDDEYADLYQHIKNGE